MLRFDLPPSVAQTGLPEKRRLTGRGYPARYWCHSPFHPNETAYIVPGENCFFVGYDLTEEERHTDPAELNRIEGITPPQAAAMEWIYGDGVADLWRWNHPKANPMLYNAAGEYLGG